MAIEMHNVISSQVAAIGYDPVARVLQVRFNNGSEYQYANVPEHNFLAMKSAVSVGQYFNANIKRFPDKYPYTKVN